MVAFPVATTGFRAAVSCWQGFPLSSTNIKGQGICAQARNSAKHARITRDPPASVESKILSRFFPWQSIIEYSSASWQEVPEEVVNSEPRLPFGPAHCRWDVSENLRHSKSAVELSCKGIPND